LVAELIGFVMNAQTPSQLLLARDSSFRNSFAMVMADAEGGVGSPVLDRRFFSTMTLGGRLNDWHTEMLLFDMDEVNRVGLSGRGQLSFYGMADTIAGRSDLGLRVSIASSWYGQAGFSRGLYELIFKGNANHVGDSMALGPFSGQYQTWQKFGLGVFNKRTFSGATLSFVTGQDFQRLEVRDASLYTNLLADSLSMSYTGEYMRSDTANKGWGAGNGLGMALDLEYNRPLAGNNGFISLTLRDFGVVGWNKNTEVYQFDSVTTWQGYSTEQLFGLDGGPIVSPNWRDSIDVEMERGVKWQMLPFSVHLRMLRYFTTNTLMDFSIRLQPGHYSVPLVQAGLSHFIGDRMILSGRAGVGGFGTFSLGAEVQWMPGGNWYLRAGTNNAAGLIMPAARSIDAFATVAYFFDRKQ